MLETIREYAASQLDASGELDSVRNRHVEFVLALTAELDQAYGIDADVLERFALERDNFRAALNWASLTHRLDAQLELAGRTSAFWANRGHLAEGWNWVESAVSATAGERTVRRAKLLLAGARFASRLGDVDHASTFAAESLEIARDLGETHDLALALCAVGSSAVERGDYDKAELSLEEAIAIARELGDRSLTALAINTMGDVALRIPRFQEALAISRDAREDEGIAVALYNLAHALLRINRRAEAEKAAHESLDLAFRIESRHTVVWDLALLAAAARLRGQPELAAILLGAADAECERIRLDLRGAEAHIHNETADALETALGRTHFDAAIAEGRALPLEQATGYALGAAPGWPA